MCISFLLTILYEFTKIQALSRLSPHHLLYEIQFILRIATLLTQLLKSIYNTGMPANQTAPNTPCDLHEPIKLLKFHW